MYHTVVTKIPTYSIAGETRIALTIIASMFWAPVMYVPSLPPTRILSAFVLFCVTAEPSAGVTTGTHAGRKTVCPYLPFIAYDGTTMPDFSVSSLSHPLWPAQHHPSPPSLPEFFGLYFIL